MAADCSFKDLCLDAVDSHVLASFWGRALGRRVESTDDGGYAVRPSADPAENMWVDPVPEARLAKTRVHLDVRLPSADPAPLLEAGATLVSEPEGEQRWWVLADPDGNLFCAMPPAPPEWGAPAVDVPTPFELVVDAADPVAIAAWWAERTGGTAQTRDGAPYSWIQGAAGFPWYAWVFTQVPEPKTVKNRLHWDVSLAPGAQTPKALIDAGATILREPDDEIRWWVLADPEGNEFCAFVSS
ncbi:MAG: VOC family protein [Actinobacteria bacterium]|nr:VOC family protein [Actinomycetota bacterium]